MIDSDRRRIGAYGLAVADGCALLVRVATPPRFAGVWTLPGGGVEWGESPVEALVREMEEETGLTPAVGSPLLVRSEVFELPEETDHPIHGLQLVYRVDVDGEPRDEVDGSTDRARWIPLAEIDVLAVVPLVTHALATGPL